MGFALVIAGLLMIVTGGRGTYAQFASQVSKDFTGPPGQNFTYWLVALGAVGAVGYIEPLRTVSRLFMVLIIIGIFLSNKGFFAQFQKALAQGPQAPQAPAETSSNSSPGAVQSNPSIGPPTPGNIGPSFVPGHPATTQSEAGFMGSLFCTLLPGLKGCGQ